MKTRYILAVVYEGGGLGLYPYFQVKSLIDAISFAPCIYKHLILMRVDIECRGHEVLLEW